MQAPSRSEPHEASRANGSTDNQQYGDEGIPQPPRSAVHARLHESFKADRQYLTKMVALDKAERSGRVNAILTLKDSIDKSASAIQSRNAQSNRLVQDREHQDAKRFDELLSQGLNPYEVARARNVRDVAAKERGKIEHRIQEKQESILKHLEVEKVWMQRQERIAQEQRAYEKKYQQEMGHGAVEERTKQYLVSRTGKETMDPTGKAFRLYPSQETTIKDRSFGLGKNLVHSAEQRHRIVDKVLRKRAHRDSPGAEPNPTLLPRSGSNNNDADRASSPGFVPTATAVLIPGQELEDLNHAMVERDAKDPRGPLPPLTRSLSADGMEPTKPKKGFGKPRRSVLEQRMLEQAREKQKTNIIQKQIVWGKEFTGRAFLADPPEIWFKDFEVGEPMTLAFTLTNVSNTFNHFKLLDLDDSIKEFFEIKFEKPGRLSAGMSCRISITFTAIQARDIDTVLPALAQTGAFSIPLRCTCKKAVPVMETRILEFKAVVAGEKQTLTLKLENQGALPLEFRIRRAPQARTSHDQTVPELDEDTGDPIGLEDALADSSASQMGSSEKNEQSSSVSEVHTETTVSPEDSQQEVHVDAIGERVSADEKDFEMQHRQMKADDEQADTIGGGLSNSASSVSLQGDTAAPFMAQRVPLSDAEQIILQQARAATIFKPDGADTPIRHTHSGSVGAYTSTTIAFTFAPASPMDIDNEIFVVEFPQATASYRSAFWSVQLLAPMVITVNAHATQVPIFVAQPELDFRCCLFDRLYRQKLVVCNRGSVALKMQIRVPKALDGCVEFNPNMGYVQGASSGPSTPITQDNCGTFPLQIKFRPSTDIWKRLEAKGFGSATAGFIAVPIQIIVPDQVVPVFFVLMARLTSAELSFSQKWLDFGPCTLGHSVGHTLEITNTSRLPQRIAFVKLPPELRLENPTTASNAADDGVATMLPHETKTIRVVYLPNASATMLASRLVCRTTMNDEYTIPVTGECIATPLVFSHSVVQLAATQLGQMQLYSIACTNNSDKTQTMELVVPPEAKSVLRVTPSVATIPARGSVRVELEFTATEALFEMVTSEYTTRELTESVEGQPTTPAHSIAVNASRCDKTSVSSNVRAVLTGTPHSPPWMATRGIPAEERSVHHTWSILCFRQHGSLVAFQVKTTVVEAQLFAIPSDLDFGQVAIGQTLVRELTFTNRSEYDVLLRSRPLHALGGFRVINSIQRAIAGRGGTHTVKVEFRPLTPLLYKDELELSCPELGTIRVALSGEGVNPSLRIHPEDGVIDFKDVLARSRTYSELQLTNASGFPLQLAIVPLSDSDTMPTTSAGLPVFTFSPSEATIPAQATLTVKVLFFPDHQRPHHYHHEYLIQVPNKSERHVLSLSGRCWENQVYVFNPHQPPKLFAAPPVEDMFDVPPSVNLSSLFSGGAAAGSLFNVALAAPGLKKGPAPLTVVFECDTLPSETKSVFVGATLPPASDDDASAQRAAAASGAAAGSYEFVIEENQEKPHYTKLFTIEPAKGSVSPAQQLPIQITYHRPASTSGGNTLHDGTTATEQAELVVSQWIQVRVTCTLRGGALWRPIPTVSATTTTAPPAGGGGKGASASSGAPTGTVESDARVVQLVLRAKMQT